MLHIQPFIAQQKEAPMILQNSSAIKLQKYCLSLAVVFAIALAVVGRATFGAW
nr:Protein of uncharacterised function (DUF2534) [Klebsiella pneumoniae]